MPARFIPAWAFALLAAFLLVPALVQTLGLRATDDAGRPVTYHLAFRDQQLKGEDTLAGVGVTEGATVTLVPVLIAG